MVVKGLYRGRKVSMQMIKGPCGKYKIVDIDGHCPSKYPNRVHAIVTDRWNAPKSTFTPKTMKLNNIVCLEDAI